MSRFLDAVHAAYAEYCETCPDQSPGPSEERAAAYRRIYDELKDKTPPDPEPDPESKENMQIVGPKGAGGHTYGEWKGISGPGKQLREILARTQ